MERNCLEIFKLVSSQCFLYGTAGPYSVSTVRIPCDTLANSIYSYQTQVQITNTNNLDICTKIYITVTSLVQKLEIDIL